MGAFYFFPNIEKYLGKKTPEGKQIATDEELALFILEKGHVVLLPGEVSCFSFECQGSKFEKPGYLRMAFACPTNDMLVRGCEALSDVLLTLS